MARLDLALSLVFARAQLDNAKSALGNAELEIKESAITGAGMGLWIGHQSKEQVKAGAEIPVETYVWTNLLDAIKAVRAAGGTDFCSRVAMAT